MIFKKELLLALAIVCFLPTAVFAAGEVEGIENGTGTGTDKQDKLIVFLNFNNNSSPSRSLDYGFRSYQIECSLDHTKKSAGSCFPITVTGIGISTTIIYGPLDKRGDYKVTCEKVSDKPCLKASLVSNGDIRDPLANHMVIKLAD